jgi:hypothetical protein
MDSIIAQVQTLAAKSDEEGRNKILNSLRDVQNEIETPMDAFFKIYNSVRFFLRSLILHAFSIAKYGGN